MTRSVAILGAGIGREHLDAYLALPDRFDVRWICDLNTERAGMLAQRCGARVAADIDEVLADPATEITDICLPPKMHVDVALKALAAGQHVILEKPVAGALADADALAAAAGQARGRVFPVFQYRFGPAVGTIGRLRAAGFLSRPVTAALETHWNRDTQYYDNPWRGTWAHELGGVVLSHAIHIHDLLTLLFGPVAEVSASLATRVNEIETEDCAAIALKMANGALASSSITLGAADNTSRLKLVYGDMTIESSRSPYALATDDWTYLARDPEAQDRVDALVNATERRRRGFEGLLEAIADALDGHDDAAPSLADGIASIELATAIYHADRTGQRVALPVERSLQICKRLAP